MRASLLTKIISMLTYRGLSNDELSGVVTMVTVCTRTVVMATQCTCVVMEINKLFLIFTWLSDQLLSQIISRLNSSHWYSTNQMIDINLWMFELCHVVSDQWAFSIHHVLICVGACFFTCRQSKGESFHWQRIWMGDQLLSTYVQYTNFNNMNQFCFLVPAF